MTDREGKDDGEAFLLRILNVAAWDLREVGSSWLLSITRTSLSYIVLPSISPRYALCLSGPASNRHKPSDYMENSTVTRCRNDFFQSHA